MNYLMKPSLWFLIWEYKYNISKFNIDFLFSNLPISILMLMFPIFFMMFSFIKLKLRLLSGGPCNSSCDAMNLLPCAALAASLEPERSYPQLQSLRCFPVSLLVPSLIHVSFITVSLYFNIWIYFSHSSVTDFQFNAAGSEKIPWWSKWLLNILSLV